ncbi:MAG: hypothetical protein ACYS6K_23725 [Planctomycetota bacterium]|jgi:hypothetical protein
MKFFTKIQKSILGVAILALVSIASGMGKEPGLEWATYYGEGILEATEAVAVAPDGSVVTTGFIQPPDWQIDTFVARYSPDGTELLNFTILDGGSIDGGFGISVDKSGLVTVTGQTFSSGFPVTDDALQGTFGGFADGYLVQLSPNEEGGFDLVYSTFFGGSGEESIVDMVADKQGGFVICGYTGSANLPVTPGAFQEEYAGGYLDAFVARIVPGSDEPLAYSTYLGGSGDDSAYDPANPFGPSLDERLLRQAVAVSPMGMIAVAGMTWSEDFPVTDGAIQSEHAPITGTRYDDADMYMTVLNPLAVGNPTKKQLMYSTYIGGEGRDAAQDLVLRDYDNITLVGISQSEDFPVTSNAYKKTKPLATQNAVVMQIQPLPFLPKGKQLKYSTYLGGTVRDAANDAYLMWSGDIVIGGVTLSGDFPVTNGTTLQGDSDLFLTRLDPSRPPDKQLIHSTYFGGSGDEGLCAGPVGNGLGTVYFGGSTKSADLPGIEGTWDDSYDGVNYDAFVAKYYLGGMGYSGMSD